MVVINSEPNPFASLVQGRRDSIYLEGRAGEWLPRVERHVRDAL
jgi:hypothetical protein